MLEYMRRKARSTTIQVIIVVIILVFVFWGVGSNQGGGPDSIATVNDENITYRQYQQAYEEVVAGYREQFGGSLPPALLEALNLKEQVLTQLIRQRLLLQGARQSGLAAGSEEVRRMIQEMEVFRDNGIFQLDRYKSMLASARMTPADFEDSIRTDLLNRKVLAHLSRFAMVTEGEVAARFALEHDEIRLEYARFAPEDFLARVTVSEEALREFHQSRKSDYQTESQVLLHYLFFPHARNEAGQKGNGPQEADPAHQLAQQAYEGIIAAGSLMKYAEESRVPLRKTGPFSRNSPPTELAAQPELIEAAFSLQKGELSSLLETGDGFAILSVEEVRAPQLLPLEEIRARVEKDFRAEQAAALAGKAAAALLGQAGGQEGVVLSEAAAAAGGRSGESGFFSRRTARESGLPGEIAAQGLKLSAASPLADSVAESDNAFYVLRFKEERAADPENLAKEKETLREMILAEKRLRILDSWLAHLRSRAEITTSKTAF